MSPADYIQANDPNDRELDYSLPVGTVSGQASVSPNGSAIYDIPILVPPGTNGVQPSLSVSYNSQSINGLLGKGWNLNATSSISRVGQVSYIDDKISAVNCSFDDRYALDGQRLVLSSGSEGQTNCAYRTEIESFSDIIVTDIQGNGPKSFIVKTKDGQILEYGGTEDSRLLGDGSTDNTVLVWYLNKMTDQNGNYIIYKYRNANGECVLDQIQYTGNANENLLPYNVIKFNYSEREDAGYAYFGGEKLNNTLILKSIEIKCDFVTKLTYIFEYSNNGFASMLQEIILNDENGNHYNSVLVDWENASQFTFNTQETEINEIEAFDYDLMLDNTNFEPNSPTIRWSGDFNGDGLTDVLEYKEDNVQGTILHVDGTIEHYEIHGSAFRILINNNQGDFIQSEIYFGYDIDEVSDVSIADIDNDGDDDFFARNDNDEDNGDYISGYIQKNVKTF
ncbi:MAG TPA: SpvB/TcaC N-terminal domain-containing protein, partial [Bacteroidales bacterium]|nr:SpvB/TcaC N-terminal domain-containing protein [Bacteroidales bacterium]